MIPIQKLQDQFDINVRVVCILYIHIVLRNSHSNSIIEYDKIG